METKHIRHLLLLESNSDKVAELIACYMLSLLILHLSALFLYPSQNCMFDALRANMDETEYIHWKYISFPPLRMRS